MKSILLKSILLSLTMPGAALASQARTAETPDSVYTLGPSAILLDASLGQDNPSEYCYSDPLKALRAIEKAGSGTLVVAPGVYWLDDPDDPAVREPRKGEKIPYAIELKMDSLTIAATSEDPALTVFAANRGQTQGAMGNFTLMHYEGASLTLRDMTFGNYCNTDLEYPALPELGRKRRNSSIVQAQVGICQGTDKLFAENCRFVSRLNLCPFVGARRSLYDRCYFECTDDALSGSGVYYRCTFMFYSTKPFYSTDATGAVFMDCDIATLTSSRQHLTKVPGAVSMIDTRFSTPGRDSAQPPLWSRDEGPAVCYQSGVTLNGRPIKVDPDRPEIWVSLDGTPLMDAYKISLPDGSHIYNVYNLVRGTDGWDPLGQREAIAEAEKTLGRPLTGLPVTLAFPRSRYSLKAAGDSAPVRPCALLWGGYPATSDVRPSYTCPTFASISGDTVCSANPWPEEARGYITASNRYGLRARAEVKAAPLLRPAPTFTAAPEITSDKAGRTLTLRSALAGEEDDRSHVVWLRGTTPSIEDAVAICQGRVSTHRTYTLTRADKGCRIFALVSPEAGGTERGEAVEAAYPAEIGIRHLGTLSGEQKSLSTDFSDLHAAYQPRLMAGAWTIDAFKPGDTARQEWEPDPHNAWYYGHGADAAAKGKGLVQASKGARLFYTPCRKECRSMRLRWELHPAKPVGQGFGSATDQYMDLYIGFDPATLTGYSLRIQRTPDYDRAVTFTLMSIKEGHATPISEPAASSCYRTPCVVELVLADGRLTATASTGAEPAASSDPSVHPSVSISAPVARGPWDAALGVQHTGSAGASATLLSRLEAEWK